MIEAFPKEKDFYRSIISQISIEPFKEKTMSLEILVGTDEANVISGGRGNQIIRGGNGDDTLYGNVGEDQLFGGVGKDTLVGGLGDDYIVGGLGDDTIKGGPGKDTLKGGPGEDTFVYSSGDFGDAIDKILDFSANDVLAIEGFEFGVGTINDSGEKKVTFTMGDKSLTIEFANGFSADDFSAANFA